jgi:hypothetical protein
MAVGQLSEVLLQLAQVFLVGAIPASGRIDHGRVQYASFLARVGRTHSRKLPGVN